jgi:hypothetical protein
MLGPYDGMTRQVLAAPASRNTTLTGSAIDVSAAIGPIAVHVVAGTGAGGGSCALKVQHSVNGSTAWADVTGGALCTLEATARIRSSRLNSGALRKYIRVIGTVSGSHTAVYGVFCEYTTQHRS